MFTFFIRVALAIISTTYYIHGSQQSDKREGRDSTLQPEDSYNDIFSIVRRKHEEKLNDDFSTVSGL